MQVLCRIWSLFYLTTTGCHYMSARCLY